MKPTSEQIDSEIADLRDLLSRLRTRASTFGERHDDAIQAQIKALTDRMDEDGAYDSYSEDDTNVLDAAVNAVRWMTGDYESAPSDDWRESGHLFR